MGEATRRKKAEAMRAALAKERAERRRGALRNLYYHILLISKRGRAVVEKWIDSSIHSNPSLEIIGIGCVLFGFIVGIVFILRYINTREFVIVICLYFGSFHIGVGLASLWLSGIRKHHEIENED